MTSQKNEIFENLTDAEVLDRFNKSIKLQNERKKAMGCTVAGYERSTGRAYKEYPDGRRVYAK